VYIACPYCTQEIKIAMHYSGRNGLIQKLRSKHSRMHPAFRMLALPSIRTTIVIYGQYNTNRKFTSESKLWRKRFVSEHKYIKKFLRQNLLSTFLFTSTLVARRDVSFIYFFTFVIFSNKKWLLENFIIARKKFFGLVEIVWNFDEIWSLWIKQQVW